MIYDVIIIGGGASGLMCAATFPGKVSGLILEKTNRTGTKLLMSGGGRCNITHAGSAKDFVEKYEKAGKYFRKTLYQYNNLDLVDFLHKNGVPTMEESDGRIFPKSEKAIDILGMLTHLSILNGFEIETGEEVLAINFLNDADAPVENLLTTPNAWEISTAKNTYRTKNLVIASGGASFPKTGSDGKFFGILQKDLSISISELKPALVSCEVKDYKYSELSGLSIENVEIKIPGSKLNSVENFLFTHKTLSGPAILNISKHLESGSEILVNYIYPLRYEEALEKLKLARHKSKASISHLIAKEFSLPLRFCKEIAEDSGESLKKIAQHLCNASFVIKEKGGFEQAMLTSGGVEISQIDSKTMEVKNLPGLYIIGEALDIAGPTGGYNLQFCWSSARASSNYIYENLKF